MRKENGKLGVQTEVIKRLRMMLPDCFILKNDSNYMQGVPDLLVLWRDRWAILEVKRTRPTSPEDFEPNQEWYLDLLNSMSFAACIYPENMEEVLDALQSAFTARRQTRNVRSKQRQLG